MKTWTLDIETAANICASRRQANDFVAVRFTIDLGGMTKHFVASSMFLVAGSS